MLANFGAYPSNRIWEMNSTDKDIDHRLVPHLQVLFSRHGEELLAVSSLSSDYKPGDIVTWMMPGNFPYIDLFTNNVL
ncbi:MAG: hypothetical protein ACI9OH_003062 [Oleispira sp.]|jgi:uncharacterized protein YijF (DUF1287 family)